MTARRTDVVVVGAGVMGAATAYHLSRSGLRVIVLERHAFGHTHGSSHGTSRIFRLAYPEPGLVTLARESLAAWRQLEADAGEPLLLRTGSLVLGELVAPDAAALERAGASYERLSGREAAWRWPIELGEHEDVLFQPDGAVILADRAHEALVDGAVESSADLLDHVRAREICTHATGVRIVTDAGDIEAGAVVVTAGAWTKELLATVSIELDVRVTRETVAHFGLAGAGELPAVIDALVPPGHGTPDTRPEQITYALASPGLGLKVGLHDSGRLTDPEDPGAPQDDVVRWTSSWAAKRFPQADASPIVAETCLYTSTPDAGFILERHGRVVVGSACSGHGFKFAPVIGRRLAELAKDAAVG